MGSDNRPAFVAEVVQLVAKGLKITWKLHTGILTPELQEGGMNEPNPEAAIKETMSGDHLYWAQVLPIALLRIR